MVIVARAGEFGVCSGGVEREVVVLADSIELHQLLHSSGLHLLYDHIVVSCDVIQHQTQHPLQFDLSTQT